MVKLECQAYRGVLRVPWCSEGDASEEWSPDPDVPLTFLQDSLFRPGLMSPSSCLAM